jgi:hypothetical protein
MMQGAYTVYAVHFADQDDGVNDVITHGRIQGVSCHPTLVLHITVLLLHCTTTCPATHDRAEDSSTNANEVLKNPTILLVSTPIPHQIRLQPRGQHSGRASWKCLHKQACFRGDQAALARATFALGSMLQAAPAHSMRMFCRPVATGLTSAQSLLNAAASGHPASSDAVHRC